MEWQSGEFDVGAGSYEPCPVPLHIIDRRGRSPDEYKSFGSKLLLGCHVFIGCGCDIEEDALQSECTCDYEY